MTKLQKSEILFISTFPPRKCGIASFTEDLITAIQKEMPENFSISVCALDKTSLESHYGPPVKMVMDGHSLSSCIETANLINDDKSVDLICVEHEFGLFGGELGEYLISFLGLVRKPVVVRFHTVLPFPDIRRHEIVQSICMRAARIIVMTKNSARILKEDYQIRSEQLLIIPHGTHENSPVSNTELKHKYNLANKLVLTSFGLLSPNKGIEKGILAMKQISAAVPEAIYIVLGQTHPNLIAREGEKYRHFLQQLIYEHHLQNNVRLVNKYLPTETLMEYLKLTDLYLFTSKDPNQAVSGTFLYAMGAGCPIISNSFVLAKEMLDDKTGVILESNSESELGKHAIRLLRNEALRMQMGNSAYLKTRDTTWDKVGHKHSALFSEILQKGSLTAKFPRQVTN